MRVRPLNVFLPCGGRPWSLLGAGAIVLAFAGCQTVDDREVAPNARTNWAPPAEAMAAPAEPMRSNSIESFASGRPLDLLTLTDLALENSPSTRIAWLAAKSAAAQRMQAQSPLLPQVAVGFSTQKQQMGAFPGLPPALAISSSPTTTYGPTYSIRQLIYDFGGTSASAAAAREALFAANFSFNQSLQDTVLAVQVNYYQTVSAEAALTASSVALEDSRAAHELAKSRNSVGLAPRGDLLRAESNLRNAEFQLEQQRSLVEQNRAALSRVLGLSITPDLKIAVPTAPPVSALVARDLQALTAQAISRRPDLLAAQATVRAREQALRSSYGGLRPTIGASLSGQESYTRGASGNPSDNWTLSLNLNWNIFDGYNTAGRIAGARAQMHSAQEALRQQQIAVVSDVWTQFHGLQSAVKQVASTSAQVASAAEGYELVEQGYRSGLNSLTDYLAAQKDLAVARQQKIQAETSLAINVARMAHATGSLEALPPAGPPLK